MADDNLDVGLLAEVAEALQAALAAPSSTPTARSFVGAVQAVLTEEKYAAAVATSITAQFNQASEATIKTLLDAVGWDLFEALVPHTAESEEVRQLCACVSGGCPVREAHLMAMEALSTPGRLSPPAAFYVIGHILPQVLRRLPVSKRASFVSPVFEAALDRAVQGLDHHTAERQAREGREGQLAEDQDVTLSSERDGDTGKWGGVVAALDLVSALLTPPRPAYVPEEDTSIDGITAHELGHIVGLLLHLLCHCLLPSFPPPLPPCPPPIPLPPLVSRLLCLLSLSLTVPHSPLTLETLLLHHTRARYNTTQDGSLLCETVVSSACPRLCWRGSDVAVACYYLLILGYGPPLPSPLGPPYVAQLAAQSVALLLKAPMLSAQGLVGVEWLLRLLPPPVGPLPLTGPLTVTHTLTQVDGKEEDCWVGMCRALTGCMVFLSEEEQRQRAYTALKGVFALLHDHSRFRVLSACLVGRECFSRSMTALLLGLALRATITAFAHTHHRQQSTPQASTDASAHRDRTPQRAASDAPRDKAYTSPFTTPKVHGLYDPFLWPYCAKPPSSLLSMGSEASEGSGELDTLMASLNLYRFLLLKDRDHTQEKGGTGVWEPSRVSAALTQLTTLQSSLTQALTDSGSKMVDEVLSHSLLPLLRGETQTEAPLPPPPVIIGNK